MFSMSEKYSEYKKRRFVLNCEKFIRSSAVSNEEIEGFLGSLRSEQQKWLVTYLQEPKEWQGCVGYPTFVLLDKYGEASGEARYATSD